MNEKQYAQYIAWRKHMLILGEALSEGHADAGAVITWSASDSEARRDFNETLWQHSLNHVSEAEMQRFEDKYDAHL